MGGGVSTPEIASLPVKCGWRARMDDRYILEITFKIPQLRNFGKLNKTTGTSALCRADFVQIYNASGGEQPL